jgi:hypothetical protein
VGRSGLTIKQALSEPERLAVAREAIRAPDVCSRTHLAAELCKQFGFLDPLGKPRVGSCLTALRDLERDGELELPARLLDINSGWRPRRLPAPVPEPQAVPESVEGVCGLRVELVDPADATAMRTWNELMLREHPRGNGRLVGRQLRYLVQSKHGFLAAVGFAASALTLSARERWIGWDEIQRRQHLDRVLNLSRLLIRPSVRCRNLASWVVGSCVRRVQNDFADRYGFEPWLLETFVDEQRHEGTCFQAANWQRIGRTTGRGRNDRLGRGAETVKGIYVYPLLPDFRERMGVAADRGCFLRPLSVEQGLGPGEWIEQEFGTVELGDKRLRDRLMKIIEDRSRHPDTSYLEACDGNRAAIKGYYGFVDSSREEVSPEAILSAHRERTISRMMSHDLVLVVQDTTDLNFSSRPHTKGLGPMGTNQTGAKSLGLRLHTSLALSDEGLPLGVLKSVAFAPEEKDETVPVDGPIEAKKSFRWIEGHRDCVSIAKRIPNTRILSVMDREADFFELFAEVASTQNRVGLLVRAKTNRCLEDCERKLFDELRASEHKVQIEVAIPRQRWKKAKKGKPGQEGQPARDATLTLAFQKVTIPPTRKSLESHGPVSLWAVYAREEQPPAGSAPIEWMLVTTEEVKTVDDAARMLHLYSLRWRIEEWHRVLKSGCRVLHHQHETAERLERVIAMDAVLAWRIQLMTLLGRQVPDLPCEVFFDEWEVKVLTLVAERQNKRVPERPLTLADAMTAVARLGGYMARPSDPPPGAKVLWRGFIRLDGMVDGYCLGIAMTSGP